MKKNFVLFVVIIISAFQLNGQDYWRKLGEPSVTKPTRTIAINDSGHIIAQDMSNFAYSSEDGGLNWKPIQVGKVNQFGTSNISLLSTYKNDFYSYTDGGLQKSTDVGKTWMRITNALDSVKNIWMRDYIIESEKIIYLGMSKGLYKTTDGGESWARLGGDGDTLDVYGVLKLNSGSLFIYSYRQAACSKDGGQTFKRLKAIDSLNPVSGGIDNDGNIILVDVPTGIYRSKDEGESWEKINNSPLNLGSCKFYRSPDGYFYILTNSGSLYQSMDNGITWGLTKSLIDKFKITTFLSGSDGCLYACSDALFKSADKGTSWVQVRNNATPIIIDRLKVDSQGNIFASLPSGFYRSKDFGNTWEQVYNYITERNRINHFIFYDNKIIAASDSNLLWTSDLGNTWNKFDNPKETNFFAINADSLGRLILSTRKTTNISASKLYSSDDKGLTWKEFNIPNVITKVYSCNIGLGKNGWIVAPFNDLLLTKDFGLKWDSLSVQRNSVNGILFNADSELVIATEWGIHKSKYLGTKYDYKLWEAIGFDARYYISSMMFDRSGRLFASGFFDTENIFRMKDDGKTWDSLQYNLGRLRTNTFDFMPTGEMVIGTGDGFFIGGKTGDIGTELIAEHKENDIMKIEPNIARNNIKIKLNLRNTAQTPQTGNNIKLLIYDYLGNELERILDNYNLEFGNYSYNIDLQGYPQGLYSCVLISNGKKIKDKFIVIK